MPHSTGRLSVSASSHHSLSSAAFITNIAESNFRHAQDLSDYPYLRFGGDGGAPEHPAQLARIVYRVLAAVATVARPDTVLAWYRKLVAAK